MLATLFATTVTFGAAKGHGSAGAGEEQGGKADNGNVSVYGFHLQSPMWFVNTAPWQLFKLYDVFASSWVSFGKEIQSESIPNVCG
jgi:hypothetical protein